VPDGVFKEALYVIQCGEVDFLVSFIQALGVPLTSEAVARELAPLVQDGALRAMLVLPLPHCSRSTPKPTLVPLPNCFCAATRVVGLL